MSVLTKEEIVDAFVRTTLEENYNFLEEDLVKLANAFIDKAKPKIELAEVKACVKFVTNLNRFVGEALENTRAKQKEIEVKESK